ncbi:MAG: peptidoglycan-associated lipoprotein Pal [Gammaproteobacteria bacterium]|nr:peptidoglycan-associated lipoprotein Pal [Gammaproteobacteria bacterium]
MKIRTLILTASLGMLFACTSTEEKPEDIVVEDQSGAVAEAAGTDSSAQAYGTGADAETTLDPLNDPSSHLSVRIIYFAYDSADVRPEFRPAIEAHAQYLAANPNVIVTLEGHADERGSREYNLALGENRANSVKRQMSLLGASAGQIRTVSYGEERPAAEGHDESAWSQNRRVVIVY